jgi:sigma-B regulation protein RsbU (phosphoserine phosphatase)
MEKRYVRKDGTVFWALLTTSVVRDPATGALLYFISAIEDIDIRKRLEAELEAAHRVQRRIAQSLQQSLLMAPPPDLYPGLTVKATYQGAEDDVLVGGDFFDIFAVAEDRVALIVGDITGKGLEAATYAAEVKFGLRAILREHTSPAVALTRLNRFVAGSERLDPTHLGQSYVAVAVAVVDTGTGAVEAAMAGTEMPFLMRAATGEVVTFEAGGPLLGVAVDMEYGGQRDVMAEGDLLVMSTDGLTEARHPERRRQFFGAEGLAQAVREATALIPSLAQVGLAVVERARAFAGGAINDDVCLLLARRRLGE